MTKKPFFFIVILGLLTGSIFSLADPKSPWELVPIENDNRDEHGFIELNGKFYIIGGEGSQKPTMEFNPTTQTWRTLKATTPKNFSHFQAVAYDNKIWIICAWEGKWPNETNVDHVWSFDPNGDEGKGKWKREFEIPKERRRGSTGVVLYKDKFYIVNGLSEGHSAPHGGSRLFDMYDPLANDRKGAWHVLADAPRTRDHFHAARLGDKLYLLGGRNNRWTGKGEFSDIVTKTDVYDLSRGVWLGDELTPPDIPTPRSGSTVVTIDDQILVLGGVGHRRSQEFGLVEALSIKTNTWRTLASMNVTRSGTQAVFFKNKIWILSGNASAGERAQNFEFASWKDLIEPR